MNDFLIHYGIKGQKWGIRRFQNPDGSLTQEGKRRYRSINYLPDDKIFISGKVSFDKKLTPSMKKEIDSIIKAKSKILIGDAPGADTTVQKYLASKKYDNVEVFTTDQIVRNNVGNWNVRKIESSVKDDERTIRRQKDIAMTKESTRGLAIMPINDRPDSAMSLNINRLIQQNKLTKIFDYEQNKEFFK